MKKNNNNNLDLAIIGSGPAALTAALYAARFGLSVTVFEREAYGGALNQIPRIANFPGFDGNGADLATSIRNQAEEAGAHFEYGTCEELSPLVVDGEEILAKAILIATGSEPIKLDFEVDTPVSYCAICDAPLYKGKNIAVIGGGNSAISEALFLADIAEKVTVITHSKLKAEKALLEKVNSLDNVVILENTTPTRELLNKYDAVFVFIGKHPATSFVDTAVLDEKGFIVTDENYQTKIPNVFAAGDARSGSVKQAITASAEGAAAAISISKYLKTL